MTKFILGILLWMYLRGAYYSISELDKIVCPTPAHAFHMAFYFVFSLITAVVAILFFWEY